MTEFSASMRPWKKAVVKVGSALVAPDGKGCRSRYLLPIAGFIAACMQQGREMILVSSGAVAAGRSVLKREAPGIKLTIPEKQALAAIGQSQLMAAWSRYFDTPCAQILLTRDDLNSRRRFVNAKNAIAELLLIGALPIVNENDTVATEELRVGDNDNLAAHVAVLTDADVLFIFSDVKGLYDKNPSVHADACMLPEVHQIDASVYGLAGGTTNRIATGGMITKIQAADKACARGIDTVIASGTDPSTFEALLAGKCPGTLFHRTLSPTTARKHWMRHVLPTMGRLDIDRGAGRALMSEGASLLPSGVTAVHGQFGHGDAVEVLCEGEVIAKGLSQYGSENLRAIMGRKSAEIAEILGFTYRDVIIHRSDMLVFSPGECWDTLTQV